MIQTAIDLSEYLSSDIRKIRDDYFKQFYGKTIETPRWKTCIENLQENFPITTSAMYITQSDAETESKSKEFFHQIWVRFVEEIIVNVDWMDERTRLGAIEKLNSITKVIAFPVDILDTGKIDEYYADYEVVKNDFLQSFLNLRNFIAHKAIERFHHKNKSQWMTHIHGTAVDSKYYPEENFIEIPVGALRNHPFDENLPQYTVYGGVAVMMGRTLAKLFGSHGRQFNQNGELTDWWTEETDREFQLKSKCFGDQLNKLVDSLVSVDVLDNGRMVDEYLTETAGVKVAYMDYKKWLDERDGKDLELPFSENTYHIALQMFWITYGQSMCESGEPDVQQSHIRSSTVPNSILVNGVTLNSENFLIDFNCGVRDAEMCTLW